MIHPRLRQLLLACLVYLYCFAVLGSVSVGSVAVHVSSNEVVDKCSVSCVGLGGWPADLWFLMKLPRGTKASALEPCTESLNSSKQPNLCWSPLLSINSASRSPLRLTLQQLAPASTSLPNFASLTQHSHSSTAVRAFGQGQKFPTTQYISVHQASAGPADSAASEQQTQDDIGYIFYNDEAQDGEEQWQSAHAKGVLAFTRTCGFWIVHSIPKYPAEVSSVNFSYVQHAQTVYGQNAACFSLGSSAVNAVLSTLLIIQPYVYAKQVSEGLAAAYPNLDRLLAGDFTLSTNFSSHSFTTLAGSAWTSYAKAPSFHISFHDYLAQKHLRTDMVWETWRLGRDNVPPLCRPDSLYDSIDAQHISLPWPDSSWFITQDHSKWGISWSSPLAEASSETAICVGDLNRQYGQFVRGGGFVCSRDYSLWSAFVSLVQTTDSCA